MHGCEVVSVAGLGNGLASTAPLAVGAAVLTEKPFCFVLTWRRAQTLCDYCFALAKSRCTKCRVARFCSSGCQRAAWRYGMHRGECELLAEGVVPAAVLDNVRLCLRMAWRLRERVEDADQLCALSADVLRRMDALAAVAAERDMNHYTELGAVLARRLAWLEPLQVTKLLLHLQTNAMRVPDGVNGAPLAVALYAFGSAANHSCQPSAIALFSKCTLELVLCEPLHAAGQAITVGYIDTRLPRVLRQWLLSDSWGFLCECARCRGGGDSELICAECGAAVECPSAAVTWQLFESIGDSEWQCGPEARRRFDAFCASGGRIVAPSHGCANVLQNAERAVRLAAQASELAAVAHKPKLRFAELLWQLVFAAPAAQRKPLLQVGGYFWRCAALRCALHCVNVANEAASEADMAPLFESAARMNLMLWQTLESSWPDRPLVLGCLISQLRCDAWLASFKMESGSGGHQEHTDRVRLSLSVAKVLGASLFGQTRATHVLFEDLKRTIEEIVGPDGA